MEEEREGGGLCESGRSASNGGGVNDQSNYLSHQAGPPPYSDSRKPQAESSCGFFHCDAMTLPSVWQDAALS